MIVSRNNIVSLCLNSTFKKDIIVWVSVYFFDIFYRIYDCRYVSDNFRIVVSVLIGKGEMLILQYTF